MSLVTMYESSVRRKRDEISRLKTDRVRYVNIVSDCSKKILSATKQANSTKSASTLKSRMNEIERENKKKTEFRSGTGKETWTLTPRAPEPKSGASTNSAIPAEWGG